MCPTTIASTTAATFIARARGESAQSSLQQWNGASIYYYPFHEDKNKMDRARG